MAGLVLRGLGKKNNLVTRGLGKSLFIIIDDGTPIKLAPTSILPSRDIKDLFKKDKDTDQCDSIQTKKIVIKKTNEELTVDVLLINKDDEIYVDSILENAKEHYENVKVVLTSEVEIK